MGGGPPTQHSNPVLDQQSLPKPRYSDNQIGSRSKPLAPGLGLHELPVLRHEQRRAESSIQQKHCDLHRPWQPWTKRPEVAERFAFKVKHCEHTVSTKADENMNDFKSKHINMRLPAQVVSCNKCSLHSRPDYVKHWALKVLWVAHKCSYPGKIMQDWFKSYLWSRSLHKSQFFSGLWSALYMHVKSRKGARHLHISESHVIFSTPVAVPRCWPAMDISSNQR